MTTKYETAIPFSGFYTSIHDYQFDNYLESEAEYLREKGIGDDLIDDYIHSFGYSTNDVLREYAIKYLEYVTNETEIELEIVAVQSPKFYNYSTDRIFATLSEADLLRLRRDTDRKILEQYLSDNFTTCDGFISHYGNDLKQWPSSVLDWDHNQIEALFIAFIKTCINSDLDEFEIGSLDHISVNELDSIDLCFDQDLQKKVYKLLDETN